MAFLAIRLPRADALAMTHSLAMTWLRPIFVVIILIVLMVLSRHAEERSDVGISSLATKEIPTLLTFARNDVVTANICSDYLNHLNGPNGPFSSCRGAIATWASHHSLPRRFPRSLNSLGMTWLRQIFVATILIVLMVL